jgi:hypothetical protein
LASAAQQHLERLDAASVTEQIDQVPDYLMQDEDRELRQSPGEYDAAPGAAGTRGSGHERI